MLTAVLLKKSTVQQKLHTPRGDKLQRPSKPDYKHQIFGLLEFWNVLFILSFYAAKNFLQLYALESGISILWVRFFYNTRIDSSHVSSVWSTFARQYSLFTSRLFRNAAGSLLTGNVDIDKKPKLLLLPPVLAFSLAQALIFLSPLALFTKRMDVLHTGVGPMGGLKN